MFSPPYFNDLKPWLGRHPSLLLLRHGERPEIPKNTILSQVTRSIGLTEKGMVESEGFGQLLKSLMPNLTMDLLMSSPVVRCRQTAELIQEGIGLGEKPLEIHPILNGDRLMSQEAKQAIIVVNPDLMEKAMRGEYSIGEKSFEQSAEYFAKFLARQIQQNLDEENGNSFGIAVSHDVFLALLLCRYFGVMENKYRPDFLEGILIARTGPNNFKLVWRGQECDFNL